MVDEGMREKLGGGDHSHGVAQAELLQGRRSGGGPGEQRQERVKRVDVFKLADVHLGTSGDRDESVHIRLHTLRSVATTDHFELHR